VFRNRISLFIATFLIIGFFFLALPEKGYSGAAMAITGCCQFAGACADIPEGPSICVGETIPGAFCNDNGQCIQPAINTPIPTLSEWGLLAMAGVLGIVGFIVIRRRKVSA